MFFSFRVVAASSYSGARALQWPHQGAKTAFRRLAKFRTTVRFQVSLTLGEDQVIGVDEVIKGLAGELVDIGLVGSRHQAGEGGEEAEANALVLHLVYVYV